MKVAAVLRAIAPHPALQPFLVHTGQHYAERLSSAIFEDLELPRPDMELGVGSGSYARQTAEVMMRFELVLRQ